MGAYRHIFAIGTETEHDVLGLAHTDVLAAVTKYAARYGWVCNCSLRGTNGCRAYGDVSNKLEYATPECRSGKLAARYELAGSLFWALMALLVDRELMRAPTARILKTNTSRDGNSGGGNHINVSMPMLDHNSYYAAVNSAMEFLQGFIATSELIFGAGVVLPPERATSLIKGPGYGYGIGARGFHVSHDFGAPNNSSEDGNKPLFQNRDEPHGASDLMWRMQICGLDSIVDPGSLELKLELILLLSEMTAFRAFTPVSLLAVQPSTLHPTRVVSLDWRTPLQTWKRGPMTALQVQWHYLAQAEKYIIDKRHGRGRSLISQWARLLSGFDTSEDVPTGLYKRVPWVTKFLTLERAAQSGKLGWQSFNRERAEDLHFLMHSYRLQPGKGCIPIQRIEKYDRSLLPLVWRALHDPPPDTRAFGRGQVAKLPKARVGAIDWSSVTIDGKIHKLPFPGVRMTPRLAAAIRAAALHPAG